MKNIKISISLILVIFLFACSNNSKENKTEKSINKKLNLDKYYKDFSGSFVLLNLETGDYKIYNDSINKERYSPCSTFKIANSLIALETKVAKNKDFPIKWDSIKNPPKDWMHKKAPFKYWMQNHTLKTAFKNSVVWYYQELARRIGNEKMQKQLKKINYGNNNISSGIDNFWLCGSLKISAKEQIEFLKKLYFNTVDGISEKSQKTVKEIMLYEKTENYKLYGKTGAGDCWDNKVIGWYVGFVETKSDKYAFAMNILVNNFNDLGGNIRIGTTKKVLKELSIID